MLRRTHWLEHIARLDPATDYEEIYRITVTHEFPWDMNQALSFALFRTYAVPSIGRLLDESGEFARDPQKRYDDTTLLLDELSLHGLHSDKGRRAIRRINQMHGAYDIGNDDMRYVLSTFVVVPKRWMDAYGWRAFTEVEVAASTRYYVELGRLMGIKEIPQSFAAFEGLLDDYEAAHFAHDPASRRVADATLALIRSFYPHVTGRAVDVLARALMDDLVLSAFEFRRPPAALRQVARGALRARARVERRLPARTRPMHVEDLRWVRSYPGGFEVERLGTFPLGCPVPHAGVEVAHEPARRRRPRPAGRRLLAVIVHAAWVRARPASR